MAVAGARFRAAGTGERSFEDFVEESLPRLVRYARWVAGPGADAEDLVQDALERVGIRWQSISARGGDAEAYTRRVIANGHVSRWRRRRREHLVEEVGEPWAEGTDADDARHGEVWQAVASLPRAQRAVVALRFLEDMSVEATARTLGVSEGTVKSHSHRALESLRGRLALGVPGSRDEDTGRAVARAAGRAPVVVGVPGAGGRVSEAAEARARRRAAAAVVAGTAALALVVLAGVTWLGGRQDRIQPIVPAPSGDASPSASVLSSGMVASTPAPGIRPSSPATSPAPAEAAAVPTTIPADFALADLFDDREGEFSLGPRDGIATGICGDELPGLATATDARYEALDGPEMLDVLGVLVFPDADAAVAFMAGIASEAASCPVADPPVPGRSVVLESLDGAWAQGYALLLADVTGDPAQPPPPLGTTLLVTRVGSSVGVLASYGEYFLGNGTGNPFIVDPRFVSEDRPPLDGLAERQCLWTVEGC